MKMRSFVIDQSLYEVVISMKSARFTTRELRDLFAIRLKKDGISNVPIAEIRLYVYEHIRRMQKAGWVLLAGDKRKRGQTYQLNAIPQNLKVELRSGRFQCPCDVSESSASSKCTLSGEDYESSLRIQLKELELEMLASMGEVERYQLLKRDMPGLSSHIESSLVAAREKSSKLIGHFRAIENALILLKAA